MTFLGQIKGEIFYVVSPAHTYQFFNTALTDKTLATLISRTVLRPIHNPQIT